MQRTSGNIVFTAACCGRLLPYPLGESLQRDVPQVQILPASYTGSVSEIGAEDIGRLILAAEAGIRRGPNNDVRVLRKCVQQIGSSLGLRSEDSREPFRPWNVWESVPSNRLMLLSLTSRMQMNKKIAGELAGIIA